MRCFKLLLCVALILASPFGCNKPVDTDSNGPGGSPDTAVKSKKPSLGDAPPPPAPPPPPVR
jgi:hypothetical protein